ncbi:MAG TPA: hypothetical protein VFQ35_13100 [Polyangiaceae bacterium]|nr:hypothetical protein [Polyangiaceae bacterium]
MPVPPLLDADLVARRLRVRARDAVFVKGVLEASEGVGVLFAEQGGDLVVAAPRSLEAALVAIVHDLALELDGVVEPDPREGIAGPGSQVEKVSESRRASPDGDVRVAAERDPVLLSTSERPTARLFSKP